MISKHGELKVINRITGIIVRLFAVLFTGVVAAVIGFITGSMVFAIFGLELNGRQGYEAGGPVGFVLGALLGLIAGSVFLFRNQIRKWPLIASLARLPEKRNGVVMKAAILADIHGNSIALNKVLEDIQSIGGVDEYWLLGDYAAIGHDPIGVTEQISKLSKARFIRGNVDRYICTGELPWPQFTDVEKEPALIPLHINIVRSFPGQRERSVQRGGYRGSKTCL
jgi:hypothetical protein